MPINETTRGVRIALVIVAALAFSNSGCLLITAGCAAGGYAYYKGKDSRTYVAAPPDVWQATHAALADLGMNVDSEDNTHKGGLIVSHTTNGKKVKIYVNPHKSPVPADGPMTCVVIRASLFGNEEVSSRILNQIAVHLAPPPMIGPVPPGGTVLPQSVPGNLPPGMPPPVQSVTPSTPSVPPPVVNGAGAYNPTQSQ